MIFPEMTAWGAGYLAIWVPGGGVGRKNLQKIWGAKRAEEGVKLLSEPPRSCLEGRKSAPKPSF